MENKKFRLIPHSDFDGLVCTVLLKHFDMFGDIKFFHRKDMQDGKIEVGPDDMMTKLPFVSGARLAFGHHFSETIRNTGERIDH